MGKYFSVKFSRTRDRSMIFFCKLLCSRISKKNKEHRNVIHFIFPLNFKFIGYVLKSKPFKVGIQGFWVEL